MHKRSINHLTTASDRIMQLNTPDKYGKIKIIIGALCKDYLEILLRDPFLPTDLLPTDWEEEKARILIRKLQKLIESD